MIEHAWRATELVFSARINGAVMHLQVERRGHEYDLARGGNRIHARVLSPRAGALHAIVDSAIGVQDATSAKTTTIYDLSRLDHEKLRREFQKSRTLHTITQDLKSAVEAKLRRLLERNPLRTDFQERYEELMARYNSNKDQVTIEQTFDALMNLAQSSEEEERRAVREGLDEESLAIFDLLKKPDLNPAEIKQIKQVAIGLLAKVKSAIQSIHNWQGKEATRAKIQTLINDYLYADQTGLPQRNYTRSDVADLTDRVYKHIYRVYSEVPSEYYEESAVRH